MLFGYTHELHWMYTVQLHVRGQIRIRTSIEMIEMTWSEPKGFLQFLLSFQRTILSLHSARHYDKARAGHAMHNP